MEYLLTGIVITAVVILLAVLLALVSKGGADESEARRAGRRGEHFASRLISEVLDERDILLTNVTLSYDGKRTELDNVIVNNRGVFIIEVKNYSGMLIGEEDDFEWVKNKVTDAGNIYQKTVKNPIPQVKRQIYILSGQLKQRKLDVWVEGYVFFVERNSPVRSDYVLDTRADINRVIHHGTNNNLSNADKKRIVESLL
ncbi:MAG: NERD domain-containing protein [Lachnospiraceae bacterium]|nr:NERD domain-containing protein [Lachnospiraceae bacterium]